MILPHDAVKRADSERGHASAQSPPSRDNLSEPAAIGPRFSTNVDGPAIRHNGQEC